MRPPLRPTLFPYTTLFRSELGEQVRTSMAENEAALMEALIPSEEEVARARDVRAKHRSATADEELRRSEEHTSELQSRGHLVCRLLLEKKKHTDSRQTHEQ